MLNEEPFLVVSPTTSLLMNGNSATVHSSLLQRLTKLVQENDSLKKCLLDNNVMVKKILNDISKWKNSERQQSNQTVLQLKSKIMVLERQLQAKSPVDVNTGSGSQILEIQNKDTALQTRETSAVSDPDSEKEVNNVRKINMFLTQTMQKYKERIEELENSQPSVEVFQISSSQQLKEVDTLTEKIKSKDAKINNLEEDVKELEEQLSSMCEKMDTLEFRNSELRRSISMQDTPTKQPEVELSLHSSGDAAVRTNGLEDKVSSMDLTVNKDENLNQVRLYAMQIHQLQKCALEKDELLTKSNLELDQCREMLGTLRRSHTKALKDYADLWSETEAKVAAASKIGEMRILQEKEATAAAIELSKKLAGKDTEIEKLSMDMLKLQETSSLYAHCKQELKAEKENAELLRMQMDLYKTDFQAERGARETQNSEIIALQDQLKEIIRQNDRLKGDLEMLSAGELARPVRATNSHMSPSNQWQEPVPSVYGHASYNTANNPQHNLNGRGVPIYDNPSWNMSYSDTALPETESETSISCPKCNSIFPNIDSLQIHMMHCLN